MAVKFLLRWIARWLEKKGVGDVADALDSRVAADGHIEAMHAIARRSLERGDAAIAIQKLKAALEIQPDAASLWCTLGAAYRHGENMMAAREAYEQALILKPDYPQALSNLGEWCIGRGEMAQALDWFAKALAVSPSFFEARLNLVAALFELGRYEEALAAANSLVADEPTRPEVYLNLGNLLIHTGKAKQGIKQYQKALELRPGYAEAHFNLASLLGLRDDMANAIGYIERQIRLHGETVHRMGLLAGAHQTAGHLTESETLCRRILERQPDNIGALVTLGSCLSFGGDSQAAVSLYERVQELDDKQAVIGCNILFEYSNLAASDRQVIFDRHRQWAERFEAPVRKAVPLVGWSLDCKPDRRLRIGYVSGDFIGHPVGFLLSDVLRHHDKQNFEIHCFSMVIRAEEVLPNLRAAADVWEDVFFLSDDELDSLIRKAEIDILIDLSGHTAHNRLMVLARRPAPIQIEWIGYFHSTGMESIDYFITDPHTSPPGSGQLFSETPVYMPHTRFCYAPPEYAPEVMPSPAERNGVITFGSFNRLAKVTHEVVAAWAEILLSVPDSRLVLKAGALNDITVRSRLLERFEARGIAGARLDLRESSPHGQMLTQYGDIDIALDTFPFNGGMTTMEALWMGVPVVTVAGNAVVSRQTVAVLANLSLAEELAFPDLASYIRGAVALANNPARRSELRQEIRLRMEASPLRQSEMFTRDLEALYRRMWQAWCRGEKLASDL